MVIIIMIILSALVSLFVFVNLSRSLTKIKAQIEEMEEANKISMENLEQVIDQKIILLHNDIEEANKKVSHQTKEAVASITAKNSALPVEDAIRILQHVEDDWFDSKFVSHKVESEQLGNYIEDKFSEVTQ